MTKDKKKFSVFEGLVSRDFRGLQMILMHGPYALSKAAAYVLLTFAFSIKF